MTATNLLDHLNPLAFAAYLKEKNRFTENTLNTYVSAARRAMRDMTLEDMMDGAVVQAYRSSLKRGTRNTFDGAWPFFANFAGRSGFDIPGDLPGKPRIRFASPLLPDLITLSGAFIIDRIPEVTWEALSTTEPVDPMLMHAARRICEFQYNSLDFGVPPKPEHLAHPIVPAGARPDPMRGWRIEWAINTEGDLTDGALDSHSAKFLYALAAARVNGVQLRKLYRLYILGRNRVQQHNTPKETAKKLISLATPMTLGALEQALLKFADEEEADKLPLW